VTVDHRAFRGALGRFLTGVCVVTAADPSGNPVGVTVNAFSSLSLEPPLVLFCIDRQTTALAAYSEGAHFAVNFLSEDQKAISELFAGQDRDKFARSETIDGFGGCKILRSCLASLECRRTETLDGGDHLIVIGQVEHIHVASEGAPLAYFRGQYHRLGTAL
jgi:flavin reductase (DIM6/NTAB) family NADH-FMN oxidoreductase RutF